MFLSTVNPEAAAAIGQIKKVGVGNVVVYHARAGYVRERRCEFPAFVLRQHVEDGSLDLLVFLEKEDFAVEERVQFRSHNQAHHCWAVVEDRPEPITTLKVGTFGDAELLVTREEIEEMQQRVLEPLLARIAAVEARPKGGRPRKRPKPTKPAEPQTAE